MSPDKIVEHKIDIVIRCINESINDSIFRDWVLTTFGRINHRFILMTVWKFLNKLDYILEPESIDYCKHALELLRDGWGDCEDFVVLSASIFKSLGLDCRIRVTDTMHNGYFMHILLKVKDPVSREWISFDGTFRQNGIGGEPKYFKEREYII